MIVAACVKWVDLRPEVDRVHGTVHAHPGGDSAASGLSEADRAAVEVALRLADAWGGEAVVVCAGPAGADPVLQDLVATGVHRAVRVDAPGDQGAEWTASLLAPVLSAGDLGASVVLCGDYSADRGSGTVPAYLAHHLGAAQSLGVLRVEPTGPGALRVVRRLDGGRREVAELAAPAVVSVEGSVAELRRAPLAAAFGARSARVESRAGRPGHHVEPPRTRPWRPPARTLAPPAGDQALDRVVHLTGALVERTPPRTVELEPAEAAAAVLDQLRSWGYLP